MEALLEIKDLCVHFKNESGYIPAVQNVSLTVNPGEVVALVGESGSGKSVSSMAVMRLLPAAPTTRITGSIIFNQGEPLRILELGRSEMAALRGHRIAMIFQEPMTSLNPVHTCGSQVMEPLRLHLGMSARQAREETIRLFEKVKLPHPAAMLGRYPHQLSGGQKQRVMIAMAISCKPRLLICDEPTTALDVTVQKTILELIAEIQQAENMGVLFITHDLSVVSDIAHRAVVMYRGKVVEQGPVKEMFKAPAHPYTRALLACRPVLYAQGQKLPVVSDFMEMDQEGAILEKTFVLPEIKKLPEPETSEPLLEVKNLSVWFPTQKNWLGRPLQYAKAVDDVSFTIARGEVLGLVGESGCGKTTLGRALLQLIRASKGTVNYKGKNLLECSAAELRRMRQEMQIVFQDPYSSLNPRLSIGSAIAEPMAVHGLYKNQRQRTDKVMELLEKVNLKTAHYRRYPHEFSGGQRQRIVIARALALNPSFIVCDESVSALDVSVQAQVLNLLNDLRTEFGFTTLFISHDLAVIKYLSHRIIVMNKGKIEEEGPADAIYTNPQRPYTQNLIRAIPGN